MKKYIGIAVAIIVVILIIIFATRSGEPESTGPELVSSTDGQNTVVISDQDVGESVTVPLVTLENPGYVVIHEDADGSPGAVIGNSTLLAGASENVTVALDRTSKPGETLYAMLHGEDNNDGEYTFPDADVPLKDQNGKVIVVSFEIIGSAGGGDESGDSQETIEIPTQTDEPQEGAVNELDMVSGNFFFNPSSTTLKKDQPVKISFKNSGTHTFTVDELGVNVSLIGSSGVAEFTPTKSGTFEYYCAVPGHKERGMFGSLQVN